MSVGALNPIDHPDAWTVVTFKGSVNTPGLAEVGAWTRELEYDIKTGKGASGATETLKGKPPAKGPITFTAWLPAHFTAWNRILPIFTFVQHPTGAATPPGGTTSPPGASFTQGETSGGSSGGTASATVPAPGTPAPTQGAAGSTAGNASPPALSEADAIHIYHPALADIGVRAVLPPEKLGSWTHEGNGMYKRTIEFVEFVLPGPNITSTPNASADAPDPGDPGAVGTQTPDAGTQQNNNAAGAAKDGQGATVPAGFGGSP